MTSSTEKLSHRLMLKEDSTPETLDNIIRYIGRFGRVQKINLVLCIFVGITVGFQNICPVFTLRTPRHRCRLPGLDNDTYTPQGAHHTSDVEAFIPLDSDGDYEQCVIWKYDVTNATNRHRVACSSWVYDGDVFDNTLTTDLDLVCDKKIIRSTSSMLIFAGKFFGAIIQGFASDRFGRRRTIFVWAIGMLVSSIGNGLVNNIPLLFVFRFFTGMTTTATYLLIYVLSLELLDPASRTMVSTVLRFTFAFGQLSLAPIAYLAGDWQPFQLVLICPSVLVVIGLGFITESPRWLLSKKRNEEAHSILRRIAIKNKIDLPESKLTNLNMPEEQHKESTINLFRVPQLALRWCILYINWIVITTVYYGLTLNISNMKGNIFINFLLVTFVDVVSTLVTGVIVNRLSRKYFHVTTMMLSGLVLASSIIPVITDGPDWVPIALSMVGKFTISAAFFLVYIYSAELFPTNHRSFGMGSCSMSGRIGGLAAPYVADLTLFVDGAFGQALPQLVCGMAGICGGLAALMLPETRGRPLPESIEDARNFTRRDKTADMAKASSDVKASEEEANSHV